MLGANSPFWIVFFVFQMFLCFFGVFSQNVFMKATVWDKKITVYCRVYMFFLSLGYQIVLITFVVTTSICLGTVGSMFEVEECQEARMVPLKLHNFGEFLIVISHLFLNLDRLMLSYRPHASHGRAAKAYFSASLLVAFVISACYMELGRNDGFSKTIAFGLITTLNLLNLMIEVKLFHYTDFVYKNTIGRVPLERRLELSTAVTMIRCFLPASVFGLIIRLSALSFLSVVHFLRDQTDSAPYNFVLNLFWNLDCVIFPWLFLMFNPRKKEKMMRLLRIKMPPALNKYQNRPAPEMQQDHFDSFKDLWKVGA